MLFVPAFAVTVMATGLSSPLLLQYWLVKIHTFFSNASIIELTEW